LAALNRSTVSLRTRVSVMVVAVAFAILTTTLGILDGLTPTRVGKVDAYALSIDLLTAGFVLLLSFVGAYFTVRLGMAMRAFDEYAEANPSLQLERVRMHVRRAFWGMLCAVVVAVVLMAVVAVTFAEDWSPTRAPKFYFGFMWIVHVGIEGTSAWLVFFHARMERRPKRGAGDSRAGGVCDALASALCLGGDADADDRRRAGARLDALHPNLSTTSTSSINTTSSAWEDSERLSDAVPPARRDTDDDSFLPQPPQHRDSSGIMEVRRAALAHADDSRSAALLPPSVDVSVRDPSGLVEGDEIRIVVRDARDWRQ
jgi:hypothetical protein